MGIARTSKEKDMLEMIYLEMQELKRQLSQRNERRISMKEFARRMNWSEVTLYDRIKKGEIKRPEKDGRHNYYLSSYVNDVVTSQINSDKVAI